MRDLIAEHAVLGSVLLSPDIAGPALLSLSADEFSPGKEQALAGLLIDMLRKGEKIDPLIVHTEAISRGVRSSELTNSYLYDVTRNCWDVHSAQAYAGQVREVHRQNVAKAAATALSEALNRVDESGELSYLDELIQRGTDALCRVPEPLDRANTEPPRTLSDLLAVEPSFDWLVPHLLERGERLMITGQEGLGKSMLLRQLACCLAAGVHPFTGERFGPGLRVLHVDAENGVGQTRRAYAGIAATMAHYDPEPNWRNNLMIENRPEGLDLIGADRAWWDRTCAAAAPDVIVTGPVYRLFLGNPNAEEDVRKLIQAVDAPRVRHHAALILEAHAGHGNGTPGQKRAMRPSGASMWMRWPENGFGLRRSDNDPGSKRAVVVDVEQWRMAREERAWPDELEHGSRARRQLPWIPVGAYDGWSSKLEPTGLDTAS